MRKEKDVSRLLRDYYKDELSKLKTREVGYLVKDFRMSLGRLIIKLEEDGTELDDKLLIEDYKQSINDCLAGVKASFRVDGNFSFLYYPNKNTLHITTRDESARAFLTAYQLTILKRDFASQNKKLSDIIS